jgi:uncharacterized tellurite resistance protein B-like protein
MEKEEKKTYLATLWRVIRSDGKIMKVEKKVYDDIAKGIGATYFDRSEAKTMAEKKSFKLQYPDRLSDRLRLFEDILFVAYCDENYTALEKKYFAKFAIKLNVNRKQLRVIKKNMKTRLIRLKKEGLSRYYG